MASDRDERPRRVTFGNGSAGRSWRGNANAVSGPTPGTVINRRHVGSTRTSSNTRLVSAFDFLVITPQRPPTTLPPGLDSTGSPATSSRTRAGKSLRLGVPTFSPTSRNNARIPFSTSRRLLSRQVAAPSAARARARRWTGSSREPRDTSPCAPDLRDATRIVAIGLVRHRAHRRLGLARLDTDRRDPRPPSVLHAATPSVSRPRGQPRSTSSSHMPQGTRPAPRFHYRSRARLRARCRPHYRRCKWKSASPTKRPTRQSIPRLLLLLDACGQCTRTTIYHPERGSHRITQMRPQSPHLSKIMLRLGNRL